MSRNQKNIVSRRRRLLENPYAHIEQVLDVDAGVTSADDVMRRSRVLLQDPYAYLDGDGNFAATDSHDGGVVGKRSFRDIEQLAIQLQRLLWKRRAELWPNSASMSPIDVLDPAKAAELLNVSVTYADSLGVYSDRHEKIAVAGLLDRASSQIMISSEFPVRTQRFTAAHELGHFVLHPHMAAIHRDRALDGGQPYRDRIEVEADKFAAYFLLPEKLVREEFKKRFLTLSFSVNEESAYALGVRYADMVNWSRRGLGRALASTVKYNGPFFYSLADYFGVTAEAIAIRLEELDLI